METTQQPFTAAEIDAYLRGKIETCECGGEIQWAFVPSDWEGDVPGDCMECGAVID